VRRVQTVTAAPDVIRTTVNNRIDSQERVRQWRITAADRTAAEPLYPWRVSRREQSLRPGPTIVIRRPSGATSNEPGVGDLFAA
jgi:hypothetical protein